MIDATGIVCGVSVRTIITSLRYPLLPIDAAGIVLELVAGIFILRLPITRSC